MNRFTRYLCFLLGFCIVCSAASAQEEWMPDASLRQAVRKKLGIPDNIPLILQDMRHLYDLVSINEGVGNLQGLEHAVNLNFLHIAPAEVSDLTPLAGLLSLKTLKLYRNNISDIAPLAGLASLQELGLEDNSISAITPLSNLTVLKHLRLHNN